MVEALAAENGKDAKVFSVVKGGRKLHEHSRLNDEYSQKINSLASDHSFDICFLQEMSLLPMTDYALFESGLKEVMSMVKSASEFILYETWGRKEGSLKLSELGVSSDEMYGRISAAYHRAAEYFGLRVSPVGENFYKVISKECGIELYDDDKTHPSYKGSALAALTHYVAIFGEIPASTECLALTEEERKVFLSVI